MFLEDSTNLVHEIVSAKKLQNNNTLNQKYCREELRFSSNEYGIHTKLGQNEGEITKICSRNSTSDYH